MPRASLTCRLWRGGELAGLCLRRVVVEDGGVWGDLPCAAHLGAPGDVVVERRVERRSVPLRHAHHKGPLSTRSEFAPTHVGGHHDTFSSMKSV